MNKQLLPVALARLLAACASSAPSAPSTTTEVREERTYRIGSNIPVRDLVGASPTATVDASVLRQPSAPPRQ